MFGWLRGIFGSRSADNTQQSHSTSSDAYLLVDPHPIAVEAPYTFFLPSDRELASVGRGDLVKITFEYPHDTEKWAAERMWVIVEAANGHHLRGKLDNHPDEPTSPLKVGDPIIFEHHHILAIEWSNPDTAPPPMERREYWERCWVDQCVLDGEEPVEYLYREASEVLPKGDNYPDSGWLIRGRKGNATDADMDAREVAYVALGAVLNRDDSWIDWIDAPAGTQLMRDFQTDTYVRAK